jgi:hypothetical protein
MRTILRALCVLCAWTLFACVPATTTPHFAPFNLVTQDPNASPTLTPFQPAPFSETVPASATQPQLELPAPSPTTTPTQEITVFPTPLPPETLPVPATEPAPQTSGRTNYILYATLDFANHSVAVEETIRYYNQTSAALSDIVLSVQPNRYSNCFALTSLSQDNAALTTYNLNGQRLTINLPQALQSGTASTFALTFNLALPYKRSDDLFGYDSNQVNLNNWYPFIVPYSGGWLLHDPMPFGEHLVYDSSDIELNLKTDAGVTVAASAPGEANGEWTRYRLYGARTFVLSASDEFLVSESAVGPVLIRSYFFNGYQGAGEGILNASVQAVGLYAVKFAPYPYESLSVVQTDIHDGQEYDGLVFLSSDFYSQYGGSNRSNLVTIGVHEISHQWWFGLVGNDQALEPWLDEAMAVYSERIFYEFTNAANNLDWWWAFRVNYFKPSGYVDTSIYNAGTFRSYVNAVYLDGAYFMEAFRTRLGEDNFYRFLKDYAARYSRSRVTGSDFFAVAREHTDKDLSDLIGKYFQGSY